ncbi:DUF4401 domain-containing protein [Pollutibacter soli]|uniref:DUF4401 domain-containing protein n=1 Tax=Pollutibacter soli TaxID=3034157 RepID=UPI0030132C9B
MKPDQLTAYLSNLRATERQDLFVNETEIVAANNQIQSAYSQIIIKVLSILGGILGSSFLFGFLAMINIFESDAACVVIGLVSVAASLVIGRLVDNLVLDTAIICFFIFGTFLLGLGLYQMLDKEIIWIYCIFFCGLSAIIFSDRFVPVFLGTLFSLGAFIGYFAVNNWNDLLEFPLILIEAGLVWLTVNEPDILASGKKLNSMLKPLQAGFFITFVGCLYFLHQYPYYNTRVGTGTQWIASVAIWLAIGFTAYNLMFEIGVKFRNIMIVMAFLALIAVPLFFASYVSGALLLILLCFHYGLITELVISLVFLLYGLSRYYYDLRLTLLVKSGILCLSGIVISLLWLFIRSQKITDEKA